MSELGFNPRYVAYANSHGNEPTAQLEADRLAWPGGSMCGFILWGREQVAAFSKEHPEAFCMGRLSDQDAYTAWLEAKFPH